MTFDEIMKQVEANKLQHERSVKEKAMFDYNLAHLMTFAFNAPEKMPKPEDVYPVLKEQEEPDRHLVSQEKLQSTYNAESDQALFLEMAKGVKRFNENKK